MRRPAVSRALARGMTLIEIMIVMVIIAIVMVGVIGGSGQLGTARLKHTSAAIAGAVKVAYTRATATSKSLRLVFDIDGNKMSLDEGDQPMLVQHDSKNGAGNGGADPATEAEQAAIKEGESILKGPKVARPHFHPVSGISINADVVPANSAGAPAGGKGPIPLPRGITFREIRTAHDDTPKTSGRAYLYFWPGGMTELADIQIRLGDSTDDSDTLTLLVKPLTGKVTVKNGPVALTIPTDDKSASEREDTNF